MNDNQNPITYLKWLCVTDEHIKLLQAKHESLDWVLTDVKPQHKCLPYAILCSNVLGLHIK